MPQVLKRRAFHDEPRRIVAYDLETTRIAAGTPEPRYLTRYDGERSDEWRTESYRSLGAILQSDFLTKRERGTWYVAWNGNRFDVYLIIRALMETNDGYTVHPLMSGSGALRGVWVERGKARWYFYDGVAMTGLVGKSLASFVGSFAPDYPKLSLDLEHITFSPDNPDHIAYAVRDTVGLWHGIQRADTIARDVAGIGLQSTVGNLGIKYFQSVMPDGVKCWHITGPLRAAVNDSLMRGGYCWCAEQWHGPVDKYDINQAYAHAQRATALPCGPCDSLPRWRDDREAAIYRAIISHERWQRVPFYGRDASTGRPFFTHGARRECWVTTEERTYLIRHGWAMAFVAGYAWRETFNMAAMIDRLEYARMNAPDGVSGPRGTMLKMIGNNAYGKTAERLDGLEIIASAEPMPGWVSHPLYGYVYERAGAETERPYHAPQLSAFITAHVRVQVMDAAHRAGNAFLYADTDSLTVKQTNFDLDIDPGRYGAWKVEAIQIPHIIIGKKVYMNVESGAIHAKGLRVRELTRDHMERWYAGEPPIQKQTQLNGVLSFIGDGSMFRAQTRRGTNVGRLENVSVNNRVFAYRD